MLELVWNFVKQHKMIEAGDRVVAGVSGGADSVCLLLLLDALRQRMPFSLYVVHVEHGIRGEASLADAEFVEDLCKCRGIPYRTFHVNMAEEAKKRSLSPEEAGRRLRYECFCRVCQETGAHKVAVAHHRDDQAETVLYHLFRGTGLRGLCGMTPVRKWKETGLTVIRPLLECGRADIEKWLVSEKQQWCTDETNGETVYTRNKLRLQVFPLVEEEIQPQASAHVAQAAARLQQVQEYLDRQAEKAYESCVTKQSGRIRIELAPFVAVDPLIQTMVLQRALEETRRGLRDIQAVHLEELLHLAQMETGRRLSLPFGVRARREYGFLILETGEREKTQPEPELAVEIPGTYRAFGLDWEFALETAKKNQRIPEKAYTKWFDYDKIEQHLCIRTRRPGDFLEMNQVHGKKKLKDYYIDCKIPREERDRLPVLADGSHVVWIPGWRISERYKVTEDTVRVLRVNVVKKESTND